MPATCQALSSYTELVATLLDSTEENLIIAESYNGQLCSIKIKSVGEEARTMNKVQARNLDVI